jgi:hypothetical protein
LSCHATIFGLFPAVITGMTKVLLNAAPWDPTIRKQLRVQHVTTEFWKVLLLGPGFRCDGCCRLLPRQSQWLFGRVTQIQFKHEMDHFHTLSPAPSPLLCLYTHLNSCNALNSVPVSLDFKFIWVPWWRLFHSLYVFSWCYSKPVAIKVLILISTNFSFWSTNGLVTQEYNSYNLHMYLQPEFALEDKW